MGSWEIYEYEREKKENELLRKQIEEMRAREEREQDLYFARLEYEYNRSPVHLEALKTEREEEIEHERQRVIYQAENIDDNLQVWAFTNSKGSCGAYVRYIDIANMDLIYAIENGYVLCFDDIDEMLEEEVFKGLVRYLGRNFKMATTDFSMYLRESIEGEEESFKSGECYIDKELYTTKEEDYNSTSPTKEKLEPIDSLSFMSRIKKFFSRI